MKASRIAALVIVLGAAAWIGSGVLGREDRQAAAEKQQTAKETAPKPRFKVAVIGAAVESHVRSITLSGFTEADKRASATARAPGVIVDLKVRRGAVVNTGDVLAVMSDEAREANVLQAKARLEQRRNELEARLRLISQGSYPSINKGQLEAEQKAAEAAFAQAKAELEKGEVRAPLSGVVNTLKAEQGQALLNGAVIAEIISLDPMLAVVEIAETQLGGIRVGDKALVKLVTGQEARGSVRFISRTASAQTRTYRVDIELPNADGAIPDGVTCEAVLSLAAVDAAEVPRSALTFSGAGRIGVRVVGQDGKVAFLPVTVVQDGAGSVWLTGIAGGTRVIVQGQDFVKEGDVVDTVPFASQG